METSNGSHPFTNRENDVLHLLALGFTNKDIAMRLNLGKRTVEYHVENIISKLDAENRVQAILQAIKNGWVDV